MPINHHIDLADLKAIALRSLGISAVLAIWLVFSPGNIGVAAAGDGLLDSVAETVKQPLETSNEVADPLLETVSDSAGDSVEAAGNTLDAADETGAEPTTALDPVLETTEQALEPVSELIEQPSAVLEAPLEEVGSLVGEEADALAPVVTTTLDTLEPALALVDLAPAPSASSSQPRPGDAAPTNVTSDDLAAREQAPRSADQAIDSERGERDLSAPPREHRATGVTPALSRSTTREPVDGQSHLAQRATTDRVSVRSRRDLPAPRHPPHPDTERSCAGSLMAPGSTATRIRANVLEHGAEAWRRLLASRPPRPVEPFMEILVPPA